MNILIARINVCMDVDMCVRSRDSNNGIKLSQKHIYCIISTRQHHTLTLALTFTSNTE